MKNKIEIGNNNKIREYVTINTGTDGGGLTKVETTVYLWFHLILLMIV